MSVQFQKIRQIFEAVSFGNGANLYTPSKLLGHTNFTTTTIYSRFVDAMKKKAVMGLRRL